MNDQNDICTVIENLANLRHLEPATPEEVRAAEEALRLSFADDYRQYVLNYGALAADNVELTGVAHSPGYINVVTATTLERELDRGLPAGFYVLENLGIGGIIIAQNSDGTVCEFRHGKLHEKVAESLGEYLERLV